MEGLKHYCSSVWSHMVMTGCLFFLNVMSIQTSVILIVGIRLK